MTDQRYDALVTGVLLMGAGAVLALHSAGRFDVRLLIPWWPLVFLIPAGSALVRRDGRLRGWAGVGFWLGVALISAAFMHGWLTLRPAAVVAIVLVAIGVRVIWQGVSPADQRERRR